MEFYFVSNSLPTDLPTAAVANRYFLRRGVNFIDTAEMYPVPNFDPKWCPGVAVMLKM